MFDTDLLQLVVTNGIKMASNKETSSTFKLIMSFLFFVMVIIFFFGLKKDEPKRVEKPVTTTKVVVKKEVANRMVCNSVVENDSKSNGSVTMKLDLGDLGFDLKNSK